VFESLRDPITRGAVTTNLLAETVLALHALDEIGDLEAGSLWRAIEALKSQVTQTVLPTSSFYADAISFIEKADGLIAEFQRREKQIKFELQVATGQSQLRPDQRSALDDFAKHVARHASAYADRRPGLVVRILGPRVGVKGPISWLSSKVGNNPGADVASLLRQLVHQELRKVGVDGKVVAFETQEGSTKPSGSQPKDWHPVWVSLEPAPITDSEHGRDDHPSSSDHGHRHGHSQGHRSASSDVRRPGRH
jgi:hypothetical protein